MTEHAREFYQTLGEELKRCRENTGLSVEYVAEQVNLSTKSYMEIESGMRKFSAYTLNLILKLVDPDGYGKN